VPAVAVIRKRLVLFILIRFKGYPDGQYIFYNVSTWLEFYVRGQYLRRRDEISWYQRDSVKAKAALYVETDVEGRRHREQTGLDTQVVFAVNDECHRSDLNLMFIYYKSAWIGNFAKNYKYSKLFGL
jgi:hypothetical protein